MQSCTLYALSTCSHCKKTKSLLEELAVSMNCIYVDTLEGTERQNAIATVKKVNPKVSFPTVVFENCDKVIVGFEPEEIREFVGNGQ
ncbi:glutaredoxin family protein [Desulfovibrio litoralis]|uniref:Glutaredoxin-like protein NrdH n=1 Tax=Desulfovibrio litoralis DSM 11393 TaxID=1121455 RepID=A0A1M7SBR4_9BACT|nr:glutaredoxin family protein [Desulfovibrio litoralis]SHN55923.1 glutaredoxin-like protein NrdH [Desulfovibrio litoralis DSM 11393]